MFLKIHLWQASRMNRRVILVGHRSCRGFCDRYGIEFYDANRYFKTATVFDKKYFPRISTNGERWLGRRRFELACFQRWFVLEQFMKREKIGRAFYADADTLIYDDVTELDALYHKDSKFAIMWHLPTVSISFAIVSHEGVKDFLQFVQQMYKQWRQIVPPRLSADMIHQYSNDMYAMRLYSVRNKNAESLHCSNLGLPAGHPICAKKMNLEISKRVSYQPKYSVSSLADAHGGTLFENNIGDDPYNLFDVIHPPGNNKYRTTLLKQVMWLDGRPYLRVNGTYPADKVERVLAVGLHFQNMKKALMRYFMRDYKDTSCQRNTPCLCVTVLCTECIAPCDLAMQTKFVQTESTFAELEDII
eukprot:CAMPEP_0184652034 /NCGR_PEP_ID=MMETSP0308-20130426/9695_1 /TAXON_ID=38269 /ORGANISM="Gloeochaete witrockiana, Strain SAG 46.84" /LENGTH=359 /DNA_ID=CAMNT_0027086649 /DNA_START=456 /DNA_END=1535 /DNA_ORIENTATION=+